MKVKLIPVKNYGRNEFKPANNLGIIIGNWLGKKNLSHRDKRFIEKIGLEVIVLEYEDINSISV